MLLKYDLFFKTKDVGSGTGLGFSISYGIIQRHRGETKVSSKESEGATFTLSFPLNVKEMVN